MKKKAIVSIAGVLGIAFFANRINRHTKELERLTGLVIKNEKLMLLMAQWLEIKRKNKRLEPYFGKNGFKTIAIYGMGHLGECLYEELRDSETVKVLYAIDKDPVNITDLRIVSPDDDLCEVDAIVVTAVSYFEEIADMLWEKVDYPIVSLEDIIRSI